MKRLSIYFALGAALLASCDPITDDEKSLTGHVSAENLQLTATPIAVDGKNGNNFIVENNSPILSYWTTANSDDPSAFRSKLVSAYDTVLFDRIGTCTVKFVGLNGDGSQVTKSIDVRVDTISNIPSDYAERLKYTEIVGGNAVARPNYFGVGFNDSKISVEQPIVNGKKGNVLIVKNMNPVLSSWNWGGTLSDKNDAEIFIPSTGTFPLSFTGTRADGSNVSLNLGSYSIDTLSKVPDEYINLFGDFLNGETSKSWEWYTGGPCWANGPDGSLTDPGAGWWQNQATDMVGREIGTMTFSFEGYKMTKVVENSDGTTTTTNGTVKVDLSAGVPGWSIGRLTPKNVNILYGINVNDGNKPFEFYQLIKVSKKTLILVGSGPSGEAWGYKFQAKE